MKGMKSGADGAFYSLCQFCAVSAQKVAENDGRIIRNNFSIHPHGFIALVTDTEDNSYGLYT
jgi:uncharacterized protein